MQDLRLVYFYFKYSTPEICVYQGGAEPTRPHHVLRSVVRNTHAVKRIVRDMRKRRPADMLRMLGPSWVATPSVDARFALGKSNVAERSGDCWLAFADVFASSQLFHVSMTCDQTLSDRVRLPACITEELDCCLSDITLSKQLTSACEICKLFDRCVQFDDQLCATDAALARTLQYQCGVAIHTSAGWIVCS